jgi:hypothetical protein
MVTTQEKDFESDLEAIRADIAALTENVPAQRLELTIVIDNFACDASYLFDGLG